MHRPLNRQAFDPKAIRALLDNGSPTAQQRVKLEAILEHGSARSASKALGCSHAVVLGAVTQVKKKAAAQGWSPEHDMTHTAPETHVVKGVSTLYGEEGEVKAQWVKTNLKNEEKFKQIEEFAKALAEDVKGLAKKTASPRAKQKDLLAVYPMGDPHIGMYAWAEEAGEDFDTDIAVSDLVQAITRLAESVPPTDEAVILNLGDFFHSDTMDNRTLRSGNALDVDTRWPRVIRMGEAAMRTCIDVALSKHNKVTVRNTIGNHDDHTSHALALILQAYYHNEPRVTIDTSPNPFWFYRFGRNLLGATHGHSVRVNELSSIMAHDRPKDWGDTHFRYWYLGHFHTQRVHEHASVIIEYFRTLASKDAWTNEHGYRSGRDMNAIIHHREYGQVERHRADILRVRDES